MSYSKIFEQIQQNIQLVYRQAIDADQQLDSLKQAGHGKYKSIFTKDEGFVVESNRFKPYVAELVEEFEGLKKQEQPDNQAIADVVARLGVILQTLQLLKKKSK
ncbi:prephenate dehydrogenase [Shewanella sp. OPT22]|nr:prephenate dehydrogenase [Shewanella sp. OPT22]